MEKYDKALFDCKVGIKAFQNINASSMGFAKMLDLAKTEDPVLMPSVFYWSVIRYAKLFINSKFEGGNISYPTKGLKKADGFSMEMKEAPSLPTVCSSLMLSPIPKVSSLSVRRRRMLSPNKRIQSTPLPLSPTGRIGKAVGRLALLVRRWEKTG